MVNPSVSRPSSYAVHRCIENSESLQDRLDVFKSFTPTFFQSKSWPRFFLRIPKQKQGCFHPQFVVAGWKGFLTLQGPTDLLCCLCQKEREPFSWAFLALKPKPCSSTRTFRSFHCFFGPHPDHPQMDSFAPNWHRNFRFRATKKNRFCANSRFFSKRTELSLMYYVSSLKGDRGENTHVVWLVVGLSRCGSCRSLWCRDRSWSYDRTSGRSALYTSSLHPSRLPEKTRDASWRDRPFCVNKHWLELT